MTGCRWKRTAGAPEQTKADTEYLARELAALRLAVGEVATRDYLRRELEELGEKLTDLQQPQARRLTESGEQVGRFRERRTKSRAEPAAAIAANGRYRELGMVTWFTSHRTHQDG